MPLFKSMWCGRRNSPESLSSTYAGALSASAERRMPRREGDVLRLGTAIDTTPIGARGSVSSRAGKREGGLLHANARKRQPLRATIGKARRLRPSGRAARLEGGEGDRLARGAIGPEHELERLIVRLAGGDRRFHHRRALGVARAGPAGEAQRMAEHHQVLLPPKVEMAEPELLVDQLDQLADSRALALRRLEIERARHMQRLQIRNPGEGEIVIRPGAGDDDRNLVLLGAVEGPFVDGGQPLHDVDGMFGSIVGGSLDRAHRTLSARE